MNFTPKRASADWLPNWNGRDEIVAMIKKDHNGGKEDASWVWEM